MSNATQVIGRNGTLYPAQHIDGSLYIVGRFVVIVEGGYCQETVCKATAKNVADLKRRGAFLRGEDVTRKDSPSMFEKQTAEEFGRFCY